MTPERIDNDAIRAAQPQVTRARARRDLESRLATPKQPFGGSRRKTPGFTGLSRRSAAIDSPAYCLRPRIGLIRGESTGDEDRAAVPEVRGRLRPWTTGERRLGARFLGTVEAAGGAERERRAGSTGSLGPVERRVSGRGGRSRGASGASRGESSRSTAIGGAGSGWEGRPGGGDGGGRSAGVRIRCPNPRRACNLSHVMSRARRNYFLKSAGKVAPIPPAGVGAWDGTVPRAETVAEPTRQPPGDGLNPLVAASERRTPTAGSLVAAGPAGTARQRSRAVPYDPTGDRGDRRDRRIATPWFDKRPNVYRGKTRVRRTTIAS